MGESRNQKDFWGNEYVEHRDDDGKFVGESREERTWLGRDYVETRHADGTVSKTYREKGLFGDEYLETIDADGGKSITREERGLFGDRYLETTHPDGSVTRSDERVDFWGKPYMKHSEKSRPVPPRPRSVALKEHTPMEDPLVELPVQMTWLMFKIALVVGLLVLVIFVVFASLPFWAGGMTLGWLSGFAMGVWRGLRSGPAIMEKAPVVRTDSGGYKVDERVAERLRKTSPDLVVPGLVALAWMTLLIWPLHPFHVQHPELIIGAAVAGVVGVVFAITRAKAGFRRGLHWSVRTVQSLPGGRDAVWGTAGAVLCAVLVPLLGVVGRSLPDNLRRDFPISSPSSMMPIPSNSTHDQNRNRSSGPARPNLPRSGGPPTF